MAGFRFLVIKLNYHGENHVIETLKMESEKRKIQIIEIVDHETFLFNQFVYQSKTYPLEDCLFLTDSGEFVDQIQNHSGYVCVSLNHMNKGEDFFHVPYVLDGLDGLGLLDFLHIYQRYAKIPWKILETERLIVREITLDDLEALYYLYSDELVQKFVGSLYENPEEEKAYLVQYIETVYPFFGYGMWIVEEKASHAVVGRAGFNFRDSYDGMELGYLIGKEFRNQGYATEVCAAIIEYIRNEFKPQEIRALTTKDNASSKKVLEKIGFQYVEDLELDGKTLEKYCTKK